MEKPNESRDMTVWYAEIWSKYDDSYWYSLSCRFHFQLLELLICSLFSSESLRWTLENVRKRKILMKKSWAGRKMNVAGEGENIYYPPFICQNNKIILITNLSRNLYLCHLAAVSAARCVCKVIKSSRLI